MSNIKYISNLHYITQDVPGCSHAELAELASRGGVDWVQLRVKGAPYKIWKEFALAVKAVCQKHNATFIINDNVELAKEIEADGVHLGSADMKPDAAREILGNDFIIGGTANTFDDIALLLEQKVDYIGLGPFRFTTTKKNLSPVLELEGIYQIVEQLHIEAKRKSRPDVGATSLPEIPIIAIGGIQHEDVADLLESGVQGIAISSAINNADNNKTREANQFFNAVNNYPHQREMTKSRVIWNH